MRMEVDLQEHQERVCLSGSPFGHPDPREVSWVSQKSRFSQEDSDLVCLSEVSKRNTRTILLIITRQGFFNGKQNCAEGFGGCVRSGEEGGIWVVLPLSKIFRCSVNWQQRFL